VPAQASGLEARELVGEGEEEEGADPAAHPQCRAAWAQLCAAAKAAATQDHQQQQQQQQQQLQGAVGPSAPVDQGPVAPRLQGRVRQLTGRLAGLLTASLAADPTAAAAPAHEAVAEDEQQQQQQQQQQQGGGAGGGAEEAGGAGGACSGLPGAIAVDDLAATAAAMSVELRGDMGKSCRLRKRKVCAGDWGQGGAVVPGCVCGWLLCGEGRVEPGHAGQPVHAFTQPSYTLFPACTHAHAHAHAHTHAHTHSYTYLQALADFLGELGALGLSRRQADVPQGEGAA